MISAVDLDSVWNVMTSACNEMPSQSVYLPKHVTPYFRRPDIFTKYFICILLLLLSPYSTMNELWLLLTPFGFSLAVNLLSRFLKISDFVHIVSCNVDY